MAAANDAIVVTCTNNSDYAVICSFFEQFGDKSGLLCPSFHDLQEMLENVEEVSYPLIELHVKLMRKLKKSVSFDRWERAAAKYAHTYSDQDGWAIERFGYKKLNLDVKLRLLKNLLEAQFDGNIKFKNEINKITSEELRLQPLGKDIYGHRYWHLLDDDCNLRVYREDLDEETWDLVSSDKESMLKLIEHLSSCKDPQEDGGTSPATSEENSANGQEEYTKDETEDQVQQPPESPIEAKRLKVKSVENPATSDSRPESIVGEAIESPILVVKGEGNGADCDTGNPGEGKNEESCESHSSNSEQSKLDNARTVVCESDGLKPCAESGEPLAILQPKTESLSSVPSSSCRSDTIDVVSDDLAETPLVQIDNETSVEANSATKPTVSENCPESPSALNPPDKQTPGSSSNPPESAITHPQSGYADSSKEMTKVEERSISPPHEDVKPISIEPPLVEVDGFLNQQGCPKPLEDNDIAKISDDDDNRSLVVDASEHPAVPKETSIFETSTQLSVSNNPELPNCGGSSVIVELDSMQPKSPIALEGADISDDTISSDHFSASSSDIVTPILVPSTECPPNVIAELEEEKQIVKPNSVLACSTLLQKDSSEIEESHAEQSVELKNESVRRRDDANSTSIITDETENQKPIQIPYESPIQPEVIVKADCSSPRDENIIIKVDEASKFCDVHVPSKDNNVEHIGPVDIGAASAIQLTGSFRPGSVSVSEKGATIDVVDCLRDVDPPSVSCSLQETSQCSESDPIIDDTKKPMFNEENNSLASANESEVAEEVQVVDSGRNDLPALPTNESTSALPTVDAKSVLVPDMKKDPETRTCSDSVNQCVSEDLVESAPETSSEPARENFDSLSVSKLPEVSDVVPENPQDEDEQVDNNLPDPAEENKILSLTEDKLHSVENEPATNCVENVTDKEELEQSASLGSSREPAVTAPPCLAKDEYSVLDLPVENDITNTADTLDKEVLVDKSKAVAEIRNTSAEESLLSVGKEQELCPIPVVSQKDSLNEMQPEEILEQEEKVKIPLASRTDKIPPVEHELESNAISHDTESKQADEPKAEENTVGTAIAEVSIEQEVTDKPDPSLDHPLNEEPIVVETAKVLKEEAHEKTHVPTRTDQHESVSPKLPDEGLCSIPVLLQKKALNEIQPEEILGSKEKEKVLLAPRTDEISPVKHQLESNAISQDIESKQADDPKAEEYTVGSALAKVPLEPEVSDDPKISDEPDPSLDDPLNEELIVAEATECLEEESEEKVDVSTRTDKHESISPKLPEGDLCSIPVFLQKNVLNEIQPEEILKQEEKEKILLAPKTDEISPAEHEFESNAISEDIELKQADKPITEENTRGTALVEAPLEPKVADKSDPSPDNPLKQEPIVTETTKVLTEETEETEEKVDVPTRTDKHDSIPVELPEEVPSHTIPEAVQKNELIEAPNSSCSVLVEPVPTESNDEIPAVVKKDELVRPELESKTIAVIPNNSRLMQTVPEEVLTYKLPEKEEISAVTVKEVPLDMRIEVLSLITSEVVIEKEPLIEEPKTSTQESGLPEENDRISSFDVKQEHLISKNQSNTEIDGDEDAVISCQPEIPVLLVKEESPPVVPDKIVPDPIRDGCGSKTLAGMLEENERKEQAFADELKTLPRSTSPGLKKEIPQARASPIPEKEEKEVIPISEVVRSETRDTLPKVPTSSATPPHVEEKPINLPNAEKSSNLNQLTFDFDASAPVTIILPPSKKPDTSAKRRGRKRGKVGHDGNTDSGKENDAQPAVLRQSSRIAKLREKEDEDRRKEEADRLQRLKEEHERREKRRTARDEKMKKMEEKQQRRQLKTTIKEDVIYRQSEEESSSSDEEKNSEEEGPKKKDKKEKRRHRKKKIDRPWDSTDSSEKSSESDVDGLDDLRVEEEHEELVFKSDHEFSPESDLDDEAETVQPTKHARTARAGTVPKKRGRSKKVKVEEEVEEEEAVATEEEEEEEEAAKCHKCGQSDHPEWILLCDRCDGGWHANCVKPPLLVIPEGHWFCPPCDHATLLERLQERLEAYEFLLQEKEADLKRRKEQELEAKVAKEEAEKQALLEAEEETREDDEEDEKISETGDLGADGEDEETSEDSGEDEDEEDDEDAENNESDENLNGRRQRKAAKQANYSFKDFDDMIKSALRDEGDEEEDESGGKGKGKGLRSGVEGNSGDDEEKPRSPSRPSGIGNKRISTSDDDSDIMPQIIRKKKARKLNDLSATSNEDDSDEDFQGSSAEGSDSEEDDEDASDSGDSFVVDDDSDDDDVVHVRSKKKARVASPTIRRSARSSRKRNLRMDSSDTSEEESEYEEKPAKRKKGNESWDSSGASSSDASWGRSKKRNMAKSKAKPVAAPKPKPKPPPRKAPANRGRGRGGRTNKAESDDEPFRSNVSVKKIKEARPVKEDEEEDSDHAQKRTTRGRQISYKELISSGESQDEDGNTAKKMGTLFAADRIRNMPGAAIRGGSGRRGGRGGVIIQTAGRGNLSGGDSTPVPVSVISSRFAAALNQDDESRFSGSTDTIEFSSAVAAATAAASAYTTGDESHTSNDAQTPNDVLTPSVDADLSTLPLVLPQKDEPSPVLKEELPAVVPVPVLSQDLQVSRLIQQRPVDVPPTLPPDLQINRLINSHTISSSSNSPARQSPGILPQQRLLRDVLDSQTPPPAVQLSPVILTQPPIIAPSVELPPYSHSGVIKQTRHSLPPTPPLYSSPHVVKTSDLIASVTPPSVIRPYPTTATASPLSPSISSTPGNPLSIQGLLGTGHGSPGSTPSAPPPSHPSGHIRPYGNTPHMIGHGPFLNHTPYANPYSAAPPPSRTSYMGTPVTPTPRQAYPPMYSSPHLPPHGLPLHSPYQHHGPPLRPTSSYQHAGFPQAYAAAAAAAASAEEERRIYRVAAQASRESGADNYEPGTSGGLLLKGGAEDPAPATAVPAESEFGGLVSYFSSQQEDFEES